MAFFLETLLGGLMAGMLYSLVALGFVLIYKASGVFNFAQGMFVVCGAYFAVTAISILQLPFPWAIVFIVVAAALDKSWTNQPHAIDLFVINT